MAQDKRIGSKLPSYVRREDTPGIRLDSGPYIGIVKNNFDPTRSGRLQIYIPDLGGDEDNAYNWRTVGYASPFMGSTYQPATSKNNTFSEVSSTYGFWAVPPDINCQVLVTFVAGDPLRGYWFACISPKIGHYMIPSIGNSTNVDTSTISDELKKFVVSNSVLPVTEFNENIDGTISDQFYKNKKPVHEEQFKILVEQGLDRDAIRGAISSSSQRESPSTVFGMSTPGAPVKNPLDDPNFKQKLEAGTISLNDYAIQQRKGGHTFVMDDGDSTGASQLMRLRTASGHQLLMNDSNQVVYLANSNGSVWMEFTGSGQLLFYSAAGYAVRTSGDMNFHADGDINMNAGGNFNLSAAGALVADSNSVNLSGQSDLTMFGGRVGIGSGGSLALSSSADFGISSSGMLNLVGSELHLNDGSGPSPATPQITSKYKLDDTGHDKTTGLWTIVKGALGSCVAIAPTHEPYTRLQGTQETSPTSANNPAPQSISDGAPPVKEIGPVECNTAPTGSTVTLDPGPASAKGKTVKNPVPSYYMKREDNPNPQGGIGPLSQFQVKCVLTQLAWNESHFNYSIVEVARGNFLGKYQIGAAALTDLGYIKKDYYKQYGSQAVNYDNSWLGKDGINTKQDFLNAHGVQETAMFNLVTSNYNTLVRNNGIKSGDDLCTVGGMLCVAHLLGAGGANTWRKTAGGSDANGTTGTTYFNMGRYAIDVLSTQNK